MVFPPTSLWRQASLERRRSRLSCLPFSVGSCHRLMRPEERAHMLHRHGEQVIQFFPDVVSVLSPR